VEKWRREEEEKSKKKGLYIKIESHKQKGGRGKEKGEKRKKGEIKKDSWSDGDQASRVCTTLSAGNVERKSRDAAATTRARAAAKCGDFS